jgi:hypothetical protein
MDDPRQDGTGRLGRDARVVVPVAPGGGSDRIARWVAVAVVLVVVAVVKPWGGEDGAARSAAGGAPSLRAVAGAPAASSGASRAPARAVDEIDPDVTLACLEPASWRVASIEAYDRQTIRIWRALDPGAATGPGDPAIPHVLIASEGVAELGWCAPAAGPDRPTGETTVQAWSLHEGTARALRLVRTGRTPRQSSFGAMYGPSSGVAGRQASPVAGWPAGHYVFRVTLEDGDERWFGVDLELRPAVPTQRPGPSPTAGTRLP